MQPARGQSEASRSGPAELLWKGWNTPFYRVALLLVALRFAIPAPAAPRDEPHQDSGQCFAIAGLGDDLYVNCGGQEARITAGIKIHEFAVAQDASYLAFTVDRVAKMVDEHHSIISRHLTVVPLRGGGKGPVTSEVDMRKLVASCGTILGTTYAGQYDPSIGGWLSTVHDLLTGERLQFPPYVDFRCSADRKTIVGYVGPDRSILAAGYPPSRAIAIGRSVADISPFGVSPNGKFIAYQSLEQLCVEDNAQAVACVHDLTGWDPISVSDSGEALLVVGNGLTKCYLDPAGHLSFEELPGYKPHSDCMVQIRWRPGDKAMTVTEGRNGQWITPEAAAALRAWGARQPPTPVGGHP